MPNATCPDRGPASRYTVEGGKARRSARPRTGCGGGSEGKCSRRRPAPASHGDGCGGTPGRSALYTSVRWERRRRIGRRRAARPLAGPPVGHRPSPGRVSGRVYPFVVGTPVVPAPPTQIPARGITALGSCLRSEGIGVGPGRGARCGQEGASAGRSGPCAPRSRELSGCAC